MPVSVVYALTIFTSAFLLFQVQPIVGKLILPRFGGSAGTWIVCLLFFQAVLLAGYLYAHWLARFASRKVQGLTHAGLLVLSAAALPLAFRDDWQIEPGDQPELAICKLLALTVGLQYFTLSTTGPLLQAWFAREKPGSVPYRLFALSNFGSMLALLTFPVVVEPFAPTQVQKYAWIGTYLVFAFFCLKTAIRAGTDVKRAPMAGLRPKMTSRLLWLGLSAAASTLLLAITSRLTQDVAPIPLLWILPLALYLASFVLTFESQRWYKRLVWLPLFVAAIGFLYSIQRIDAPTLRMRTQIALYLASAAAIFMACHGELAKLKPEAKYLTSFYLLTAIGGVCGGLFVGIFAPRYFVLNFEYGIGLTAAAAFVVFSLMRDRRSVFHRVPLGFAWAALLAGVVVLGSLFLDGYLKLAHGSRSIARNFYGILRVTEDRTALKRTLLHGAIVHGEEFIVPWLRRIPTTYYGKNTGAELAIAHSRLFGPQRVGVVGLGTGTLATYGRTGDYYRFYEINPLVPEIARNQFHFLKDSQAIVDISLGDARLSLEKELPQQFDALLIDAFSGDSIPVHLLTREAFAIFLKHLKPTGILAVHVSNQYLDLAPIVERLADEFALHSYVVDSEDNEELGVYKASWVLLSAMPIEGLAQRSIASLATENETETVKRAPLWTDDYSSVFPLLK